METKVVKLTRDELEQLFKKVIEYLKEERLTEIKFIGDDDYYCKIWKKDIDFNNPAFMECPPFTTGSHTEDIKDMKKILSGNNNFVELDLEKLGAILIGLGETM